MSNVIKIARSGGTSGHTATIPPSGSDLKYGELAWLNGSNRIFIGRATANPTVSDGSPAPYEFPRRATATSAGIASFATGDFSLTSYDNDDGTGNTVSIKAGGVSNSQMANSAVTVGSTAISLGASATTIAGVTKLTANELDFPAGNRTFFGSQADGNILTIGNHANGKVVIKGDLQIDGDTTTVSSTTVTVSDKDFVVANGASATNSDDGGFYVSDVASLTYDHGNTRWASNLPIAASSFVGNVTGTAGSTSTLNGVVTSRMLGRTDPGTGAAQQLTAANVRTFLNIADGATANTGDITSVTAGTGMTGGGTSGAVTLNCSVTGNATHTGDVTGSGALTIGNDKVTYAKMQNVSATNRILGRDTAGAGNVEEISPANLRTMLNVADGATSNTGDITGVTAGTGMSGGGTSGSVTLNCTVTGNATHTGDVTGSGALTIGNDKVTYAKMQNVSATARIMGRNSSGAGDMEELTAGNIRTMLNVADGATANVGDITAVTAGTGLTGGGTSGAVTLNISSSYLTNTSTIDGGSPTWS